MEDNKADLFSPIWSNRRGPPPIVIRAIVTTNNGYMSSGIPQDVPRAEDYILLSALPEELKERVKTAIHALIAGM